ncbi:hypothetical protein [Nonomuraea rubra]|uniref:hypothetical protein n=1 Tax=Nonomuraea rubra TaxID=46180 RepID=UPI0031EBE42C
MPRWPARELARATVPAATIRTGWQLVNMVVAAQVGRVQLAGPPQRAVFQLGRAAMSPR